MKEVTFARTPPLPSYLVAFAVGDFDVRDARPRRPQRHARSRSSCRRAAPTRRRTRPRTPARSSPPPRRSSGSPIRFPKLDLVAYPRSTFGGAMENPGLVTYTAQILLARPDEMSPLFEQRFMRGHRARDRAHVVRRLRDDGVVGRPVAQRVVRVVAGQRRSSPSCAPTGRATAGARASALQAIEFDRLQSARRIRQPVTEYGDMRAAFDGITYAKGETILAMFEQWLGPEKFRDGVRRYVAKHAWGNATADDFFAALAATDDAVIPAFRGFVERAGVPLLNVALDCTTATPTLALAQQRFGVAGAAPAADGERWVFPACFEYGDGAKGRQTCALVRDATQIVPLDTARLPAVGRREPHGPRVLPAAPHARAVCGAAEGGQGAVGRRPRRAAGRRGDAGAERPRRLPGRAAARRAAGEQPEPAHRASRVRRSRQHAAGAGGAGERREVRRVAAAALRPARALPRLGAAQERVAGAPAPARNRGDAGRHRGAGRGARARGAAPRAALACRPQRAARGGQAHRAVDRGESRPARTPRRCSTACSRRRTPRRTRTSATTSSARSARSAIPRCCAVRSTSSSIRASPRATA